MPAHHFGRAIAPSILILFASFFYNCLLGSYTLCPPALLAPEEVLVVVLGRPANPLPPPPPPLFRPPWMSSWRTPHRPLIKVGLSDQPPRLWRLLNSSGPSLVHPPPLPLFPPWNSPSLSPSVKRWCLFLNPPGPPIFGSTQEKEVSVRMSKL